MKLAKPLMLAAFLAVSATSGMEQNADAQNPDKWLLHYPVKDFTFDFPASPSFSVEVGGGVMQGNVVGTTAFTGALTFRGSGTLSSPELSPPHTGMLVVDRAFGFGDFWDRVGPICLQMAMAHAALPAGSPRHFVMHFSSQNGVYSDMLADTRGFPNVQGATYVTCSER
jgi:hypothetical protein